MQCTNCGVEQDEGANFCRSCGHAVQEAPTEVIEEWPATTKMQPPLSSSGSAGPDPRVGGWAVAIVLFGLVGGLIGWFSLKTADRRRADHVLKWGAITSLISVGLWISFALALVAIVAHSASNLSSGYTSEQTTTNSAYVGQTTTTTAISSTPLGSVVADQAQELSSSDGYSASAAVNVYQAAHADALPALPFSNRSTLASCSVNSETDGIIPVSYTVTNTTKSFSMQLGLQVNPNESDEGDLARTISADVMFSGNTPSCTSLGDGSTTTMFGVTFNDPIAPQASADGDLFVIVPGYYSPAHPNGNPAMLDAVTLEFGITTTSSTNTELTPDPADLPLVASSSVVTPTTPSTTTTPVFDGRSGVELNNSGYALMRKGDYRTALPRLEAAVAKLDGTNSLDEAYAKFNLANTRFQLGDCTDVLSLLSSAQTIEGTKAPITALRAKAQASC
jgi:hypothetical protein